MSISARTKPSLSAFFAALAVAALVPSVTGCHRVVAAAVSAALEDEAENEYEDPSEKPKDDEPEEPTKPKPTEKVGTYRARVGAPKSSTDPEIGKATESFKAPAHVSFEFRQTNGDFSMPAVEIGVYKLDGGERTELQRKDTKLDAAHNVLWKSWRVANPGNYLVEAKQPGTGKLLATSSFTLSK